MKLLIWGAGAIGGTIGAFLSRAGHDVTLVDVATDHVATIRKQGIRIAGPVTEFSVKLQVATPDDIVGRWETILLCVKAQDTAAAARALMPHLSPTGCVVSVQNGLNELEIGRVVGDERTVGCFVNFGADYMEPGLVMYGGRGSVVVGELDGAFTPRVQALHRALLDFEPEAIITNNIWGYLWGKLAYGAQLFVTALTNEPIHVALADERYRPLFVAVAQEVLDVAAAQGITPESFNGFNPRGFMRDTETDESMRSLDEMVAFNQKSAKSHSGIWRDLAVRKRKSESEALLGKVTAFGSGHNVATPLTELTMSMISEIEGGVRAIQLGNLDELMQILPRST